MLLSSVQIFIGFQMKTYKNRDNDNENSININRKEIKEKSGQILLASK